MLKLFNRYRLVVVFSLIMAFLIPFSLGQPAETEKTAIVTSVGMDKVEGGVELSVNVIVPNSAQSGSGGSDGAVKTVTAVGNNVSSAFANITLVLGKMPGLAHCDSIILNKNLFEINVLDYLDFFIRTNNLTSNATLIVAENTAKEIVETSASQKGLRAVALSDILLLNNEYALTKKANIDAFYVEHFSPNACSTLPLLTVGKSNEETSEVGVNQKTTSNTQTSHSADSSGADASQINTSKNSASEGDNGSEQGKNDSPEKIIKNEGKGVIVKNGKIVKVVSGKEMAGINLMSKNTKRGHIQVKGITDKDFNNADLTFKIFNKKTRVNGCFVDGKPVFNYNMDLVLKLEEVGMNSFGLEALKTTKNYVEGVVKEKLNQTVQQNLASVINTAKQTQCDILGVYDYFHKMHNTKWLNFINSLPQKEDFLNYVTFTCNIKTQGKI